MRELIFLIDQSVNRELGVNNLEMERMVLVVKAFSYNIFSYWQYHSISKN